MKKKRTKPKKQWRFSTYRIPQDGASFDLSTNSKMKLTEAFTNYFSELKGENKMNKNIEPLIMPDIQTHKSVSEEKKANDLAELQKEADKRNILLPTELNARPDKPKDKEEWDESKGIEPLIPPII